MPLPATTAFPALLVAGRGVLAGLSVYESAGAVARLDLYDGDPSKGGERILPIGLASGGAQLQFFANPSIQWVRELWGVLGAGAVQGNIFVIPQMLINGIWVDDQTYGGGHVVETDDIHQVAAHFGLGD